MAETPPPFNPAAPQPGQKQSNPIIWVLVALAAACCVCVVAGSFASWTAMRQVGEYATCPMTMGVTNNSLKKYVEENGVFPAADTWQDDIRPYYEEFYEEFDQAKSEAAFMKDFFNLTPPGEALVCFEGQSGSTGIYYNSDLAGKKPEDIEDLNNKVTLYEAVNIVKNANGSYTENKDESEQKIFGETRPFYKWTYDKEMDMTGSGTNVEFNIE